MHLADVEKAFASHDLTVLERVFGALICFQEGGRIEGAKTVDASV